MLEGIRDSLAALVATTDSRALLALPDEVKAVVLGSGIYDFHGASGTGSLVYSDGRGALDVSRVTRNTAYAVAAMCYAAIEYRASNLAEAPLRVARRLSDGSEEFVAHPLDDRLEQPSLDYDMAETIWQTVASLDLFARALWVKDEDRMGRLGRLFPLSGAEFSVEAAEGRVYGRYRVDTVAGREAMGPERVVHFKFLSPYDRYRGVSPTDAALGWLNLGEDVETSVRRLMLNGMFPSIVLSPDKDWKPDPEEMALFKATITAHQTGPANTGKPLVALGGTDVNRVSFSLRDLLPDEMLDRIEATVAMCFGIAPVVLGALVGLKNSPWSQFKEARRGTYDDTIIPLWQRMERALTTQLLRPIDSRRDHVLRFDTSRVAALQEDRTQQIKDAKLATFWSMDERRAHTGQDELGGEEGAVVEALTTPAAPQRRASDVSADE